MNPPRPFLSVIVPAHQAAAFLPGTLGALAASDLPRDRWELIVVDDASTDMTASIAAEWADRVVTLPFPAHGPAFARNHGVEASRGEWVVFIDADVRVHADTLRRFVEAIGENPSMDAVFGAYDEEPAEPGFLSRYRNLLHRYVHLCSAGESDSFWAGCGAVRHSAFVAVGGFDAVRYPRPQIEDIELGYRLQDRGSRAIIRPEIQGTHLKRWTFAGALRTDLFDRGIPWVRLLLERERLTKPAPLNLKQGESFKIALVGTAIVLTLLAWPARQPGLLILAGVALGIVLVWNHALIAWFSRKEGPLFALAVLPFNLLYYAVSGAAVAAGLLLHLSRRRAGSPEEVNS
jgi:glycosyltransferase involved in cell wall biosynthesis